MIYYTKLYNALRKANFQENFVGFRVNVVKRELIFLVAYYKIMVFDFFI